MDLLNIKSKLGGHSGTKGSGKCPLSLVVVGNQAQMQARIFLGERLTVDCELRVSRVQSAPITLLALMLMLHTLAISLMQLCISDKTALW